jgi:hypothetical protein
MFLGLKLALLRDRSTGQITPVTYYYLRSDNSGNFLQPTTNLKYARPQ